jgi:DNA-binding CsgD family transcriptional regulator
MFVAWVAQNAPPGGPPRSEASGAPEEEQGRHVSDETGPLSEREMELLRLLTTGATNREIAQQLFISVNTVKVHLRNIYGKLGVASRTEATMVAVREGWIAVPRSPEEGEAADEPAVDAGGTVPEARWPRVALAKRIALVLAGLVAVVVLFVPEVLQGAGGPQADPISGVFPTEASSPTNDRWRRRAQMPTPRTDLAVVAHNGLIYAIGGVNDDGATGRVEVYDPQLDAWTTRSPKPTAVGLVAGVSLGAKIYVPGGFDADMQPQTVFEVYDPVEDAWVTVAPLPTPLGAYGLVALEGQIYLFGGSDGTGFVETAYRYDPEEDTWTELAPLKRPRGFLAAAALGDSIYVVGGFDGEHELSDCDVYDPASDRWAPCPPMEAGRGGLALVAVREQLYALGGGMERYLAFNERYDRRTGMWYRLETPVREQWRGLGAVLDNRYLYAIGGWNGEYLSTNETYQALFQVFAPLP